MKRSNQKGSALIFALIFILVLSVTAASLMFLSQSETWASMNYRMMTQARYGAEAGVNAAANYIMNTYVPAGGAGDPLAAYNMTVSPVTFGGGAVVLSSTTINGMAPNYPAPSVQTAFDGASSGSLTISNGSTVNYVASAELMSMQQVVGCANNPATLQTWKITADGNLARVQNAQVEVSAILEHEVTPCFNYAAFGTFPGCGALSFGGGAVTNSYDSSLPIPIAKGVPTPTLSNTDGNVGANGNLNENGNKTTINGTLSTPDTGVGNCANGSVDAWTDVGGATVTGGTKQLPQPIVYQNPVDPPPGAGSLMLVAADCSGTVGCSGKKGNYTLDPSNGNPAGTLSLGDITVGGGATVTLGPGTYNINSLTLTGNSIVNINPGIPPQPIIINVTGNGIPPGTPVIDFTGGSLTNSTYNSALFRINYAGTGTITMSGGASASGVINAPNAAVNLVGGSDWYGAVIGNTVTDTGGTAIHYDRHLQTELFNVGQFMLDSFTWSKF
jgi:type IV pilus assembly PilX-like protein